MEAQMFTAQTLQQTILSVIAVVMFVSPFVTPLSAKPAKPVGVRTAIELLGKKPGAEVAKLYSLNGLKSVSRS
jgi:hypothetical protein